MYKNYRFRICADGRHVAGFSVIDAARGSAVPITLERGVTHDADFERWVSSSNKQGVDAEPRDLQIDVFEEDGTRLTSYTVTACRISVYLGMPYMDSGSVAIRTLRIDNAGWRELES